MCVLVAGARFELAICRDTNPPCCRYTTPHVVWQMWAHSGHFTNLTPKKNSKLLVKITFILLFEQEWD